MNILAIDPGYAKRGEGCAVAVFRESSLVEVSFVRRRAAVSGAVIGRLDAVVVEMPQQDGRTYGIPPEVLALLSWEGAAVAYSYASMKGCGVIELTPDDWKGTMAKPVSHDRMWEILSPAERAVLGGDATYAAIQAAKRKGALARGNPKAYAYPSSFLTHNLLDAAALGCVYLGRLKLGGKPRHGR